MHFLTLAVLWGQLSRAVLSVSIPALTDLVGTEIYTQNSHVVPHKAQLTKTQLAETTAANTCKLKLMFCVVDTRVSLSALWLWPSQVPDHQNCTCFTWSLEGKMVIPGPRHSGWPWDGFCLFPTCTPSSSVCKERCSDKLNEGTLQAKGSLSPAWNAALLSI